MPEDRIHISSHLALLREVPATTLVPPDAKKFDAVFVPAGTVVAIHVDRELAINLDPQSRKLNHALATAPDRHHRLD